MNAIPKARYDTVSMLIHWVTAALLIFMIFFGEDLMATEEEGQEAGEALAGTFLPSLHVSIGVTILVLTLLRILWRISHPAPPLPPGMKPYAILALRAVHGLFYLLMIGLPLTGWLAFGELLREEPAMAAVRVFGAIPLPASPAWGEWTAELHEIGSNVAMVLVGLHILAALKHQVIDKDGLLGRMLPH